MVESLYCEYSGRPSINLVVLFKIVLIQHLYGCPFLRWAEEAIEWVFADDKEKHAMRYTLVKLKFAAMNLKKMAGWLWKEKSSPFAFILLWQLYTRNPAYA